MSEIVPNIQKGLYLHHKSGKFYFVSGVATSCNNNGAGGYVVVYRGQNADMHYRDYDEFVQEVEINGALVPRFEKV